MTRPCPWHSGQPLTPIVVDPVDPAAMRVIALLQDDPNPIHWDPEAAARAGLGDRAVNQGSATASWLLELASGVAGSPARVRELRARFLGNVFAGDRVECGGTVASVDLAASEAELRLVAAVEGDAMAVATARIGIDP